VYRIGTVARLAQVSVRTLRYYDEIGLLQAARVDPATGYRWYTPEQVGRLHRILALRDLGLSLDQVRAAVATDVTVEQLRGMLLLRRSEAHDRLTRETDRLARVEARLRHLEGGDVERYDVVVKAIEPLRLVVASTEVRELGEIGDALGRLYPLVHGALHRHAVAYRPPSYALYEHSVTSEVLRVCAAVPVADGVTIDDDAVTTLQLPAVARAATTVVRGAPDACFHDAFDALHSWASETGNTPTGADREVYLDCDGPRDTWVTELQLLLA
jgi:DNA-binding transcriptional MerR regulator